MLNVYDVFLWIFMQCMLVQCIIPGLKVNKLDKKLIERKRQDTLDMCRLFAAEGEKLSSNLNPIKKIANHEKELSRSKREINFKKEGLDVSNARRIESIVDKLYDDITENGKKVAYRRRDFGSNDKDHLNKTIRRFNFAPAELTGSANAMKVSTRPPSTEGEAPRIAWPKKWKHGIVPYFIDSKTYDSELAGILINAFDYFEKTTCIRLQRLRDRPTDKNSLQNVEWLYITNPSGIRQCVHSNERKANKGVQMVVFGYDCLSVGEIVHEIMHVLGFSHEHIRPDRDQYITVLWNNIKSGYKKYFEIRTDDLLQNIPYDYASVLHYPPRAFSKNGKVTIFTKSGIKLGQRQGLSETDVEKIGLIYGNECVDRNKQYLLKTCPSVVKIRTQPKNVTHKEVVEYFKDRLWPYGVVNYKIKDKMEFSAEEIENIKTVIRHIEQETCIKFRELYDKDDKTPNYKDIDNKENIYKSVLENEIYNDDNSNNRFSHQIRRQYKNNPEIDDKNQFDNIITNNIQNDTRSTSVPTESTVQYATTSKNTQGADNKLGSPSRRHVENILTFTRSLKPGCACPEPGKPKGNKVLQINSDCFNSVNDLLHLFVHILGLDHQHNMYDRDSFLHILWKNLTEDIKTDLQQILPPAASVGFAYDYQSVMHYPWLQIKNGVSNIMYPIWNDGWAMGHWQGLSSTDVSKINLLYTKECRALEFAENQVLAQ
ncbi:uncharacterized protein LOC116412858 [Galleria mellonella]|uniref:Metalloendopeptidase n=1 Tax=Galleria mellonella TaxID=7137 RepID=A0A6J3BXM8_GALME|nr:uncharacterized protein LOC116412858 [Galleria mellonella]